MDDLSKGRIPQINLDKDFEIFFPDIINFLHQSLSEEKSQKTSGYQKKYKGLDVKISFGKGNFSVVPWICFLKEGQDIQDGYYPGFYFDRELSKLFVVLGVSEANTPSYTWPTELTKNHKTFGEITVSDNIKQRFPSTFLYSQYDIDKKDIDNSLVSQKGQLFADLNQLIGYYQKTGSVKKYWQIAPNAGAKDWGLCVQRGIIPVYFNDYIKNPSDDILGYSKEQLIEYCQKNNPDATRNQVVSNAGTIWNFIHNVQIGDNILANRGTKIALGWGVITSKPKISRDGSEITFYHDVEWKDTNLNRNLSAEQGKNFFTTMFQMTKEHFESIINPTSIPTDPIYAKMQDLLDYKKQIILYGPPGTGKTFHAKAYIDNQKTSSYDRIEKTLLDQRIFLLTIYAATYKNIPNLKVGEQFSYPWKGTENWQCYFKDLQVGDIALTYYTKPLQKLTTVVRCDQKENDKLIFSVLHQFDGATFQDMRSDPLLKDSNFMKTKMSFSLTPITKIELQQIMKLSQDLTYEKMEIIVNNTKETIENTRFLTFHPSFGYEDFIEGLRPNCDEEGAVKYRIEEGIFKEFSRQAFNVLLERAGIEKEWEENHSIPMLNQEEYDSITKISQDIPFYLIIDEINRGDISRIFGELITLIEADKRYGEKNGVPIDLSYSKQKFAVPPNLLIIGTMNTSDKSIALVDLALRRRFGFIEVMPDNTVLSQNLTTDNSEIKAIHTLAVDSLKQINAKITANYDRDHQIGHSYFIKLNEAETKEEAVKIFHIIWYHEILPLLQEYYYDSPKKLQDIIGKQFVTLIDKRGFQFNEPLYGEEFLNAIKNLTKIQTDSNN